MIGDELSIQSRTRDDDSVSFMLANHISHICDQFESDWLAGGQPRMEDHLVGLTGPERAPLVDELLAVELHWRRKAGDLPALGECLERFLEARAILARKPTLRDRAAKWSLRRRKLVTTAIGILVLAAAGPALGAALMASQRDEARRQSAEMMLDRGLETCRSGDVGKGMLLMARGLEAAPPEAGDLQNCLRANLAGWRTQLHAIRQIFPHEDGVRAVAFSPDGKSVATACGDGTAQVWDIATGTPRCAPLRYVNPLSGKPDAVSRVAYSPDGRLVVTGADGRAQLWDASTGTTVGKPMEFRGTVWATAFSPDGKTILTAGDRARLWEAATQKSIWVTMDAEPITGVAFSPDGKTFATASMDNIARLWDAATGRALGVPMKHREGVVSVAFSPDGRTILTGCCDNTAQFWDVDTTGDRFKGMGPGMGTGKVTPLHEGPVGAVAISPDGMTMVTGSRDKTARLWEVRTGRSIGAALKHRGSVHAVAFSPDGKYVLTGSEDGTARVWQIAPDEAVYLPVPKWDRVEYPDWRAIEAAAFRPDGLILATAHSDGGRLWKGTSSRLLNELTKTPKPGGPHARHVAFSPDGRAVLVIQGNKSRVWDALTGRPISSTMPLPDTKDDRAVAAAFWPDERTITMVLKNGHIGLWQASTGQQIRTLPGRPYGPVTLAVFSPDRKTVMTVTEHNQLVVLCDVATGRQTALPSIRRGVITALSVRPDGKVALTGDGSGVVRLWDVTTRAAIGDPLRHEGPITTAAFSPDGRSIVTASADKTTRLWDATTGQGIAPLMENEGPVVELAFSANGKVIAARTEDSVRTFTSLNGEAGVKPLGPPWQPRVSISEWGWEDWVGMRLKFEGIRPEHVEVMALSADGRKVLATCERDVARQWRVPSPLTGDPSRLALWVEVLTARELDAGWGVHELDPKTWSERRERLQQLGGPPTP